MPKGLAIFALVLFFGLGCLLIASSLIDIIGSAEASSWPFVLGHIAAIKRIVQPQNGAYGPRGIRYYQEAISYEVRGKSYQADIIVGNRDYTPLRIFFDPRDPSQIRIGDTAPRALSFVGIVMGLLCFFGGIVQLRFMRAKRSAAKDE